MDYDDKSKPINVILAQNGFENSLFDEIGVYVVDLYHHNSFNILIYIEPQFERQTRVCMQVNTHLKQCLVGF